MYVSCVYLGDSSYEWVLEGDSMYVSHVSLVEWVLVGDSMYVSRVSLVEWVLEGIQCM